MCSHVCKYMTKGCQFDQNDTRLKDPNHVWESTHVIWRGIEFTLSSNSYELICLHWFLEELMGLIIPRRNVGHKKWVSSSITFGSEAANINDWSTGWFYDHIESNIHRIRLYMPFQKTICWYYDHIESNTHNIEFRVLNSILCDMKKHIISTICESSYPLPLRFPVHKDSMCP